MRERRVRRLPVVDGDDKLVGMVTMDDSLRHLYSSNLISREECESRAEDKVLMRAFFKS